MGSRGQCGIWQVAVWASGLCLLLAGCNATQPESCKPGISPADRVKAGLLDGDYILASESAKSFRVFKEMYVLKEAQTCTSCVRLDYLVHEDIEDGFVGPDRRYQVNMDKGTRVNLRPGD